MPSPLMYAHGYSVKVFVTTCDRTPSYLYQTRQSLARWGIAHDVLKDDGTRGSAGMFDLAMRQDHEADYTLVLDDDVEWLDWFGNCIPVPDNFECAWSLFSLHKRDKDLRLPTSTVYERATCISGGCALFIPRWWRSRYRHNNISLRGSEKTAKVAMLCEQFDPGIEFMLFRRNAVKHIGDVSAAHPGLIWSQVEHLMMDEA